jgi:hypothetical protein
MGVFDDAIMKIMPKDRKMNSWARSNFRDIINEKDKTIEKKAYTPLKEAFNQVPTKAWRPLFDHFDKRIKMKDHAAHEGQDNDRGVSVNFIPLKQCGTVEFRRPPDIKTAADAQKWAAFAVAFASAALQPDWHLPWVTRPRHATVEELQTFVQGGVKLLGWPKSVLDTSILVENTSQVEPPAYDHVEETKRKLAKANREISGFAEQVSIVIILSCCCSHLSVIYCTSFFLPCYFFLYFVIP